MAYASSLTLLPAGTTTNLTGPIVQDIALDAARRKPLTIYVSGVFGGANVQIMASPDGCVTWVPISGAGFTSPGTFQLEISATAIQAVVTGATGTTNLSAVAI